MAYTAETWAGGFVANLTITNTGSAPVNGWTLRWTFPGDAAITNMWNATPTQTGRTVEARNLSHNATIAPGATASHRLPGQLPVQRQRPHRLHPQRHRLLRGVRRIATDQVPRQ